MSIYHDLKYIWYGLKQRIQFVMHFDVSRMCDDCIKLEDWGECHYCREYDECFNGRNRLRRCKKVDIHKW